MFTDIDLPEDVPTGSESTQDFSDIYSASDTGDETNHSSTEDVSSTSSVETFISSSDDSPHESSTVTSSEENLHNNVTSIASPNVGANPYSSGFDDEHPIPSYKELRNAGFTDFEAKKIVYGTHDMYSDKELFECLYGSDDPKAAYDAMIREKTDELLRKIDTTIANI